MRATLYYICILFALSGCKPNPLNEAKTIIIDLSDTMTILSELTGQIITNDLQLLSDKYAGATVKLSLVTDRRFNKTYTSSINPSNIWDSDELKRNREVKLFIETVDSSITEIKSLPPGIAKSRIFETLLFELDELALNHNYTRRSLNIISDLQQNSEGFNSYDSLYMSKLIANPKEFNRLMDSLYHPARSYKGISINIYHQPRSAKDDTMFYEISRLLIGYLKSKGVNISIKTTLS